MDAKTEELRAAHDVLAEFYADRLADVLDQMPAERAVLGLFCDLTLAAEPGGNVVDVGCGTGRLEPYLAARGLSPSGVDLSPGMIRVARRDHPGFGFDVADVRELPFAGASLAGVVCWYSLMFLAPAPAPWLNHSCGQVRMNATSMRLGAGGQRVLTPAQHIVTCDQ